MYGCRKNLADDETKTVSYFVSFTLPYSICGLPRRGLVVDFNSCYYSINLVFDFFSIFGGDLSRTGGTGEGVVYFFEVVFLGEEDCYSVCSCDDVLPRPESCGRHHASSVNQLALERATRNSWRYPVSSRLPVLQSRMPSRLFRLCWDWPCNDKRPPYKGALLGPA